MLGEQVTINQTLVVTVFSMAIVFLSLLAISFILDIFKMTLHDNDKKKKKDTITKPVIQEATVTKTEENEELIAVITAAIAASIGKSSESFIVRNITRILDQEPAWTKVGRLKLMR